MKRRCCFCGVSMGEKEPLDDDRETSGICEICLKEQLEKIDKM
jgi:lipoate synthase